MKLLDYAALLALTLLCCLSAPSYAQTWTGGTYEVDNVIQNELLPEGDTEARSSDWAGGSNNCYVQANSNHINGSATIKVKFKRNYTYSGPNPPTSLVVTPSGRLMGYISSSSATAKAELFKETGGSISDSAVWPNFASFNYSVGWGSYTPPSVPPTIICYAKATGYQASAKTTGYLTN